MFAFNLVGDINESAVQLLSEFISDIQEEIETSEAQEELEPIVLNISSRGGEIEAMFACVDLLEGSGMPIITNVNGYCYSSALPLFLSGDIRTAGRNSLFMYHKCSYGIDGTILNHQQQLELSHKMQSKFDSLITEKCSIEQDKLDAHKHEDWYFDVNEAIEMGVVHITDTPKDVEIKFETSTNPNENILLL